MYDVNEIIKSYYKKRNFEDMIYDTKLFKAFLEEEINSNEEIDNDNLIEDEYSSEESLIILAETLETDLVYIVNYLISSILNCIF